MKENTDKCRKFHFNPKRNAISEILSFLLCACVQNEVTGIHKFSRREIWFIGTFYVSFSYELCARKSLNRFKLQGSEKPEVTLFVFAVDRCEMGNTMATGKILQKTGSSCRNSN